MNGTIARLTVLLAATTALVAAPAAETAPAAKPKSPWQLFRGAQLDQGRPVLAFGWAANRVWVVTPYKDVPMLWSARAAGGRLTSFAQMRIPDDSSTYFPIIAGQLVLGGVKGADGYFTAPLLSNGRLGAMKTVPDDVFARAQEAAPKWASGGILDGVPVGNRIVWALGGQEEAHTINGAPLLLLACCNASGAAVNLTQFIDRKIGVLFPHIGRDARGHIWLAWLDHRNYSHAVRGVGRILELDPSTLAPRSKAVAIPGVIADRVELACGASCRLVAQTAAGDIDSWAPGERSPTRVVSGWDRGKFGHDPAWLLGATYRSGYLQVAYYGNKGKTQYFDSTVRNEIRVLRGDTRGASVRAVASIPVATNWPPQNVRARISGPTVFGVFVPGGLAIAETFTYTPGYYSPVAGAFVPVGA